MRVSPGALTWGGEIRIDGWCVRRRFRNGWRKEEEYVCCLFYYPRWRHISLSIRLNFKSPKIYFPKSDQKAERLQLAHVFNPQPSFGSKGGILHKTFSLSSSTPSHHAA